MRKERGRERERQIVCVIRCPVLTPPTQPQTHWLVYTRRSGIEDPNDFQSPHVATHNIHIKSSCDESSGASPAQSSNAAFESALDDISCDFFTLRFLALPPKKVEIHTARGERRASWDAALDKAGLRRRSRVMTPGGAVEDSGLEDGPSSRVSLDLVTQRSSARREPGMMTSTTSFGQTVTKSLEKSAKRIKKVILDLDEMSGAAKRWNRQTSRENLGLPMGGGHEFPDSNRGTLGSSVKQATNLGGEDLAKKLEERFSQVYNKTNLPHLQKLSLSVTAASWLLPFTLLFISSLSRSASTWLVFLIVPSFCSVFSFVLFKMENAV